MVREERLELSRLAALVSKTSVATITPLSLLLILVGDEGFEPSVFCSQSRRINQTFLISDLVLHDRIELPSPDYKTGIIPIY